MNKYNFKSGAQSKQVIVRAIDNATGLPDETLLYNTAGLSLYYRREGGDNVSITLAELATPAINDPWLSGGFIHIDNGYYRLDIPDASLLAGVNSVLIHGVGTDITIIGAEIMIDAIADEVWDEILSGSNHNIATSAGRRLRELASNVLLTGTSPGVNTANTIILDSNASSVDGTYDPAIINIVAGKGAGQSRQIFQYDGATKTAWINRDWKDIPDNTSEYQVNSSAGDTHVNEGAAQAGTSTTITLNADASPISYTYNGQFVFLVSGTGQDQLRRVMDYNGTTKVATVDRAWDTIPDATTVYAMLPADDILVALGLKEFDGVSFNDLMQLLVALAKGNMTVTGVGTGTLTISLLAQDGTTVLATFSVDEESGARTLQ